MRSGFERNEKGCYIEATVLVARSISGCEPPAFRTPALNMSLVILGLSSFSSHKHRFCSPTSFRESPQNTFPACSLPTVPGTRTLIVCGGYVEVRPGGSGREVCVSWESIQGMEHVCMHYITILSTPANKQGMSSSLSESHSQNSLPLLL